MKDTYVAHLRELRCSNEHCGGNKGKPKVLAMSLMMPGSILEIKCKRCGTVTRFESEELNIGQH